MKCFIKHMKPVALAGDSNSDHFDSSHDLDQFLRGFAFGKFNIFVPVKKVYMKQI